MSRPYRHTARRTLTVQHRGQKTRHTITASAVARGVYADLSFDGMPPVEVINLYDYEAGSSSFTGGRGGDAELGRILQAWADEQDAEELECEGHEELGGLGESDRCDGTCKTLRREWLRLYVENS